MDIVFHLHFCSRCCSTCSVHVRAIASLHTAAAAAAAAAGVASYSIIQSLLQPAHRRGQSIMLYPTFIVRVGLGDT